MKKEDMKAFSIAGGKLNISPKELIKQPTLYFNTQA